MIAPVYIIILILTVIFAPIFAIHSLLRLFKNNGIKFLIDLLTILFCISLFSAVITIIYYFHFYLGNNDEILRKMYFGLLFLSITLFIVIILLKLLYNHRKKQNFRQ
jgi:hypothetical protein